MKETLRKFYDFASVCAYTVGSIGGFGWACYGKGYFIAFCVLALAAMAFPFVRTRFKDLINN